MGWYACGDRVTMRDEHMIKRQLRIVSMFSIMLVGISGCRPETSPVQSDRRMLDKKDLEIQEGLKLAADWRSHFDLFHVKRSYFLSELNHNIHTERDEAKYKRYLKLFEEVAFDIPTDADDPGTRVQQLESFSIVTAAVARCAEEHDDWDAALAIGLRRLERLKEEWKKLKVHFPDGELPGPDFCYSAAWFGSWDHCFQQARQNYGTAVKYLSWLINNFLMVNVLTYERWKEFHARLEEIVGHEIPIKRVMTTLWEEKKRRMAAPAPGTNTTSAATAERIRRRLDGQVRGLSFIDARTWAAWLKRRQP